MKRHLFSAALVLGAALALVDNVQAESWIFGQPLYAPPPANQQPASRRPEGGPFYTRPHGAFFSSGLRNSRTTINVRGRMVDNTIIWESWYQTGAQY